MAKCAMILTRVTPTAKAVSLDEFVLRAEVLLTLRKRGSMLQASIPFQGLIDRDCLGRGYDLIHQVLPAPSHMEGKLT